MVKYQYKNKIEYKILPSGYKNQLCKVIDCETGIRAKQNGLCCMHYKIIYKLCTSKCKEKALDDGSGKCTKHRGNIKLKMEQKIKYKILPSGYKQRLCYVLDCEKAARKGGLCNQHKNIKDCIITNCNEFEDSGTDLC